MSFNIKTQQYEGFIYLIQNKINGKQYIGQTIVTIDKRWNQHVNAGKRNPKTVIDKAIKKYGKDSFILRELDFVSTYSKDNTRELLNELEKFYIYYYHTLTNQGGYNVDAGGNSGNGIPCYIDVYHISGTLINTFSSIRDASEYYNIDNHIIYFCCKGKAPSYNNELVFRYQGDPFDKYDVKTHTNYRDVYKFSLDGELLGRYYSYGEVPDKCHTYIHTVIDNPNLTAGGYWWSSTPVFNYQGRKDLKKVKLYNLDGILLDTFNSINECSQYLSTSYDNVNSCCLGLQKTVMNKFVTRYLDDEFDKYDIQKKECPFVHKVNQYSLNGDYIATYSSINEASRIVNTSPAHISYCCYKKPGYKSAKKYKWFFADDIDQPDKTKVIDIK